MGHGRTQLPAILTRALDGGARGLQTRIAEAVEKSSQQVGNWKIGKHPVPIELLPVISRIINVPLIELLRAYYEDLEVEKFEQVRSIFILADSGNGGRSGEGGQPLPPFPSGRESESTEGLIFELLFYTSKKHEAGVKIAQILEELEKRRQSMSLPSIDDLVLEFRGEVAEYLRGGDMSGSKKRKRATRNTSSVQHTESMTAVTAASPVDTAAFAGSNVKAEEININIKKVEAKPIVHPKVKPEDGKDDKPEE